jgi:hypothetical protein
MALYPATLYGPAALAVSATIAGAGTVYDSIDPATSASPQAANVAIVKQIIVCNTAGTAGTFSLYLVSEGAAVAAGTTLFEGVSLGAGETKIINTSLVLRGAQLHKLHARASATTVILTLVGLEEY